MKNLIAVLALTLFSASAFAEPVVNYLSVNKRNSSVSPMFRTSTTCTISSDGKVFTRKITGDIASGSSKKIVWKGIPNDSVLQSLIVEASKGQVIVAKCKPPVGAARIGYEGYKKDKAFTLKTTFGGMCASINRSPVTERLIKFVDVNCGVK